jgi:hypothetical protein
MRDDTWILTATGGRFDLLDPRIEDVKLWDMALATAGIRRFTGHVGGNYTVNTHTRNIVAALPWAYKGWGYVHDLAEAYTGDASTPLKRVMRMFSEARYSAFDRVSDHIESVVFQAFGFPSAMPEEAHRVVKQFDLALYAAEKRDLMPAQILPWTQPALPTPLDIEITFDSLDQDAAALELVMLGVSLYDEGLLPKLPTLE